MKTLQKLVNKTHKWVVFLEKPLGDNRRLHIDRIFAEVQRLHGVVHEIKVDHNEAFDTMVISWTDEWLKKHLTHPVMYLLHTNKCIQAFNRLEV